MSNTLRVYWSMILIGIGLMWMAGCKSDVSGALTGKAGKYQYGFVAEGQGGGTLLIHPLDNNDFLFYLEVNRGAPSFNSGTLYGRVEANSENQYDHGDCILHFSFSSEGVAIRSEEGHSSCGFGHGVRADGRYKRIKEELPQYFQTMTGDTIYFDEVLPEDW